MKPINYAHINMFHKKGYWFKIWMEFLRPPMAKIELICQQLAMPQLSGVEGVASQPWGDPNPNPNPSTVLSKDTTAVTSSEPIKIKLVVDSAPPTRVISVPTTESISFSSGSTSAGDISIESTDIHEKNSVNTQAFEAENTSSQWGHALKKNQNYRYPPRWKKPPKSHYRRTGENAMIHINCILINDH